MDRNGTVFALDSSAVRVAGGGPLELVLRAVADRERREPATDAPN